MPGKRAKLNLPPAFVVSAVDDVKSRMQTLLQGRNTVYVDFERVTDIDTAGLQLLVAFTNALRASDREYSLSEIPSSVADAIELGGFQESLEFQSDAAA